jgi:hypothetical protein
LSALVHGNAQYEQASGLKPAEGLGEFYVSGDVSPEFLAQLWNDVECDPWNHGFAIVLRDTDLVIGSAGSKGSSVTADPKFHWLVNATEVAVTDVDFGLAPPHFRLHSPLLQISQ